MATVNWKTYDIKKPKDSWQGETYTPTQFKSKTSPYAKQPYAEDYAYDVSGAKNTLNNHIANKPGEYQSQFQPKINDLMSQLNNRKGFTYDANGDSLYEQYKNSAVATGNRNMQDAMGQAAANTGGFGNSYAQTVGQQAYNDSMIELQNMIPQLAQMSLERYQNEGDNLYNQLNMYQTQDDIAYNRHRDDVADWTTERDRLSNYLLALQELDRSAFDSDRDFNQAAWEFAENQRYNSWNDSQSRKQAQVNANNANSLAVWQQMWNNYLNGESQNATNKANALDMLYKLALMEQDGYTVTGF